MAPEIYQFFATSALGLEEVLAAELRAIGAASVDEKVAGVQFSGPLEVGYRACLWSRVANRILLPLKTFSAPDPDQLYAGVRSIHWSEHLTVKNTLAVDFASSKSKITHTHFGALKVKDAVVDQFRTLQGERPSVDPQRPDVRINVYLNQDQATVSLDLSGESLHRRGYRQEGSKAPLKENLAAALLMMAGWPNQDMESSFLDPMCGSGTLPIEAAMISGKRAPGLYRDYFGFKGWQGHVPALWKRLVREAEETAHAAGGGRQKTLGKFPKIVGYDHDFKSVRVALQNIERAGLVGRAHIEKRDFNESELLSKTGIIMVNPPYGERLGETESLKGMYRSLGDLFKKRFKGWEGYILTGSSELSKCIGLKASKRLVVYNGPIECRLFKYDLY